MPKVSKQIPKKKVVKKTKQRGNKSGGVLDRISSIGFDGDDGIKMLLYGRSTTGKTTLWATFPKPILAVICSGGGNSEELRSIDTKEYRRTIEKVALEEPGELNELIEYQKDKHFATVVIDHATGLQDLFLKGILGLDEIPTQPSWGLASRQQYGQCALQLKTVLRKLLGLSCNVVIIAQERTFEGDEESSLDIMPTIGAALSPSTAGWLNTACSYICQTYIRQKTKTTTIEIAGTPIDTVENLKGVDYCLRTAPDATYMTKFRNPKGVIKLPEQIVDPSYSKIMKFINQGD